MKKYITIGILLAGLLFGNGCSEWLFLEPEDGIIRQEYWKSKEDVHTSLMGAYQAFAKLDATLFLYGELRADLIDIDVNTRNDHKDIKKGNIVPDNSMCDWSKFYTVINYCNSILKNAINAQ